MAGIRVTLKSTGQQMVAKLQIEDNTEYVYYTKEGEFLGGKEDSEKIYLTTQTGYDKAKEKSQWSLINLEENLLKLFEQLLSHKDFLSYGGIVNGEATNRNSIDVDILEEELKEERYCFANVVYNYMKQQKIKLFSNIPANFAYAKKDKTAGYNYVASSKPENRNDKWIKIALYAVINAITGGKDYSNGATQWDGGDVFTGNYASGYDPMKHFRQNPLAGTEYRIIGIYDKNNFSQKMYENLKKYYTKYDTHRAKYLKPLHKYDTKEHYDIVTIRSNETSKKLETSDGNKAKESSYNQRNTILEPMTGTGVWKVVLKCLWEVTAQKACSIFYNQLNNRY